MQNLLEQGRPRGSPPWPRAANDSIDGAADLIHQLAGLVEERNAAEDDLGIGDRAAVLLGDRDHDDEDAVRREHAPVAQRDVGHVADLHAVDEDHARLLVLAKARAALVDVQRQPVVALEDVLGRDAHRLGQLGVQAQALEVAVEGHHVARLDQVEHQLDLLGVAVPGGVHGRVARGHHVAADVVEAVDGLVHRSLVAGDRRGGEHHRVALVQLDLRVVAVGHAPQGRQRLALGAGGDDDHAVVGEVARSRAGPTSMPVGHLDVAQRPADVDVLAHRAPDQRRPCVRAPRRRRPPAARGGCSRRSW